MTASMVSSGIPWFFTKQNEYRVVMLERWYDILGGYRTVEKSDVRTSLLDVFGQCSSSGRIEGSDVDEVTVRDEGLSGSGPTRTGAYPRAHITGMWEKASEAIISGFCVWGAVLELG